GEDEGVGIIGVDLAVRARIAGAEIAVGIVAKRGGLRWPLDLPLPGALGALRRHQHPFAVERVEAAVRSLRERRHRGCSPRGSTATRPTPSPGEQMRMSGVIPVAAA